MIRTVFRCQNGMVIVFDKKGEQIPEYQGKYDEVRERSLKDAPPEVRFGYFPKNELELRVVPREEW